MNFWHTPCNAGVNLTINCVCDSKITVLMTVGWLCLCASRRSAMYPKTSLLLCNFPCFWKYKIGYTCCIPNGMVKICDDSHEYFIFMKLLQNLLWLLYWNRKCDCIVNNVNILFISRYIYVMWLLNRKFYRSIRKSM